MTLSFLTVNTSNLSMYFKCNGYEGYHLVYSPQIGVTCVSPCSEGYCQHGGRCQHLPDGPHCRWEVAPFREQERGLGEEGARRMKLLS